MSSNVAVVTGSSSGIGKAIAIRLAQAGFDVIVHAGRNGEAALQVAKEVKSAGRQASALVQDFSGPDHLEAFVDQCWNWQGNVTVWINNAGVDVLTGDRAAWNFEQKLKAILQVDVIATLVLSRAIGKRMTESHAADGLRRSIINIGWDQAGQGMAGDCGEMFAASKGAVMAASRSLAQSLAPAVRVNCIAPGWIQTSWGEQASSEWQQRATSEALLNRWGTPRDVAEVAAFLASESAEFVNGQIVNVNGGYRFSQGEKS